MLSPEKRSGQRTPDICTWLQDRQPVFQVYILAPGLCDNVTYSGHASVEGSRVGVE